jgi:hypothetical protein
MSHKRSCRWHLTLIGLSLCTQNTDILCGTLITIESDSNWWIVTIGAIVESVDSTYAISTSHLNYGKVIFLLVA